MRQGATCRVRVGGLTARPGIRQAAAAGLGPDRAGHRRSQEPTLAFPRTLTCLLLATSVAAAPAARPAKAESAAPNQTPGGASLVDGEWVGRGSFQLGSTLLTCSEIRRAFVGTPALYGVRDGAITCETISKKFPMKDDFPVTPGNEVFYKDRKIGEIVGNRLSVVVPGDNGIDITYILQREGDFLYYLESARAAGQMPVFGMAAILRRLR